MSYGLRQNIAAPKPAGVAIGITSALPVASSALLAASLVLWAVSLDSIDPRRATDIGLISALPASFFVAVFLLTASFGLALVGRQIVPLLVLQLAVQVLVLFGTPSFVEYGPRTQTAWRLAGIVDYITQHHSIDRGIDAFFNWPGFFVLVSFVTRAAGLSTSLDLARWAPLFFNLAYALPLLLIFRTIAVSKRQIWIGLWLFFAGNWVGQDYLSPQAFAYFVYLTIIAILLAVFPSYKVEPSSVGEGRLPSPRARAAAIGFVLVLYALIVPSHQLTPWLVALSVGALVLVRRLPTLGLPLVMALMAATWVAFFTGPYLAGHFGTVAGPVGTVGSNVHQNLGSRFAGSSGHLAVVRIRVGFTVALGALALWGGLRLRRGGAPLRTIAPLAVAPFLALGLQSYGGELLLRTFLFSLPFLALAGAAALAPLYAAPAPWKPVIATAILLAGSILFLAARYGNEKMDSFTKQEGAAVRFLYANAPPGARVFSANDNVPWQFKHYADYRYQSFSGSTVTRGSVKDVLSLMDDAPQSSYLLLSRSQEAEGELISGWPSGTVSKFRADLLRSGRFRIVFTNKDAAVLKLRLGASSGKR